MGDKSLLMVCLLSTEEMGLGEKPVALTLLGPARSRPPDKGWCGELMLGGLNCPPAPPLTAVAAAADDVAETLLAGPGSGTPPR